MDKRRDARLRASANANESENVVPFVRPQRETAGGVAPTVALKSSDRPAPGVPNLNDGVARLFVLLLGSLVLHSGLLMLFTQEPEPYSSVGIPTISVEIVLGAEAPAGIARTPSSNETQEIMPAEEQREPVETRLVTKQEPETPVRKAETEMATETPVIEPESLPLQPKPERPRVEAVPQSAPVQSKQESKEGVKQAPRPASRSTPAARGVGIGRSSADANYHGLVAAHLSRHKQFPADARARRDEGTAIVTFAIDGRGYVTSVRLTRSSGVAALDQESQAMPRRASPFPPPPNGQPMSFTVPLSFHIR
jgi:protein TonB